MKRVNVALIILALLVSLPVAGQIRQGDRQYDLYRFSKAIPYYKKALKSKDDQVRAKATVRLGDCYRMMNDVHQAKSWYSKAVEYKGVDPMVYFHLGQAMRSTGEYERARGAFQSYSRLRPDDVRGELFAQYSLLPLLWSNEVPGYEIRNLEAANTQWSDFSPAAYKEGIVFVSDRGNDMLNQRSFGWTGYNYLNLYQSEPAYYKDYWSGLTAPKSMSGKFNQSYHDGPVYFTADGSQVYITRTTYDKVKKGKEKIATRRLKIYSAGLDGKPTGFEPFFLNSNDYSVAHPTLSGDGKTLVFSSDKPGGYGGMDLYQCRLEGGKWGSPVNLGPRINTTENEVFPHLAGNGDLYFSSNGLAGYGGLDIYLSNPVANQHWGDPVNLLFPINSTYDDFGVLALDKTGSGLFSSSRPGGRGNDDIYAFRSRGDVVPGGAPALLDGKLTPIAGIGERPPTEATLSGYVKDKQTLLPLDKSKVFMLNTRTNRVKVLETDPQGNYTTPVQKGVLYMVKAMKEGYVQDCLQLRFDENDPATSLSAPRDLLLNRLEIGRVFVVENIYYDFDKWFIRPDAALELNKLVQIMVENPIRIELGSHTDSRGSDEYNIRLSQRRADAAIAYIISQGIASSRLIAKGYGESRLTNHCSSGVACNPEEHQANRRTEFTVIGLDPQGSNLTQIPDVFKAGDEPDLYVFPVGFFSDCLGLRDATGVNGKPANVVRQATPPAAAPQQPTATGATQAAQATPPAPAQTIRPTSSTPSTTPAEPCYGVQLLASKRAVDLNDPLWSSVENLNSYYDGTMYRYVAGCEADIAQAKLLKDSMQAKGYKAAFVVKLADGQVKPAVN